MIWVNFSDGVAPFEWASCLDTIKINRAGNSLALARIICLYLVPADDFLGQFISHPR